MTLSPADNSVRVIEATDMRTGLPMHFWLIPGQETIALQYEPRQGTEITRQEARRLAAALMDWAGEEQSTPEGKQAE